MKSLRKPPQSRCASQLPHCFATGEPRFLFLLLFLGCALRLWGLGKIPAGLNQDEASALYDGWAILRSGTDRNGYALPVLLRAWGSGQNALYSYLAIPFIAIFGLNSVAGRLPMALAGCASLWLLYDLCRRLRGEDCALWVLLALAVNPWHVLLSRWALESNLLPFMLLSGAWCLSRVGEKETWLIPAAAVLALSLYAYGTAYFFLILFLPVASAWLWREKAVSLRCYLLSLAVFILIALPVSLCQLRNALGLGAGKLLFLSLPELSEGRQSATSILGGGSYGENCKKLLRLLWTQNDGLVWNCAAKFGLLYGKAGLLLSLAGLGFALWDRKEPTLLLWLLSALLACGCVDVNVNRVNMLFLPLVYFQGVALWKVGGLLKRPAALALPVLLAAALFARFYFTDYAARIAPAFYDGLCEAIADASEREDGTKFCSYSVNMPYIFVLFTSTLPPEDFLDSVEYMNPGGAFEWVSAMEGWHFGSAPNGESCAIVRYDKVPDGYGVAAQYGEWCVCVAVDS